MNMREMLVPLLAYLVIGTQNFNAKAECVYPAQCVDLGDNNECLGVKLDYSRSSVDLANDSSTLEDIQQNLVFWSALQGVPRCWDVIQPLLCAVYMPKCDNVGIEMYRQDLCLKTKEPCKVVPEYNDGEWPSFLQCDQSHFTTDESCSSDTYTSMKFSYNSTCLYPLVRTDNEASYYEGIDGCGIQCQNPLFTDAEHDVLHICIAIAASLCLISTLVTSLTFVIDWKNSCKYPSVIIFYINVCFFMGSIGWLAQFLGKGARDDIVCRHDQTMRLAEPLIGDGGETVSCTVVFFIVYYFMMAGVTWFVVLAYSWHVSFKKLQTGSVEDKLQPKIAYFHIVSWALPLVCAIIAMSLQKVDGDSLSGICFVGYVDGYARGFLVLFPITVALCVGLFFLLQGVARLYKMRQGSSDVKYNKATAKITATILRLGTFSILAFIFVMLTLILHIYDFGHKNLWEESFKNFIICKVKEEFAIEDEDGCVITNRPNLATVYLNIFSYFGAGIMMSSWAWTKASKYTWKRFLRKVFQMPTNKPVKLKSKHKMIALAFQRKQEKKTGRRFSLDFHTSHDDPLGMKLDLVSVTSHDMSSAWLEAMPKLVRRRGGMALPVAGTLRRYSDSDISSMIASRRASLDSQLSDAERFVKARGRRQEGADHRGHRGLGQVNPADIAAFNAKRRGSNLSQKSIDDIKAHFSRRISDASAVSNASALNISIDCEDIMEPYIVRGGSKRDSINSTSLTNTAQLEQLTLATCSMFTASSLLPKRTSKSKRFTSSSREQSAGSASSRGRQLHTPNAAYVNGALDDADNELSDISL